MNDPQQLKLTQHQQSMPLLGISFHESRYLNRNDIIVQSEKTTSFQEYQKQTRFSVGQKQSKRQKNLQFQKYALINNIQIKSAGKQPGTKSKKSSSRP